MPVQKCKWTTSTSYCTDANGLDLAARWFGMNDQCIEKLCGRFARGKHKGKLRGWIVYRRCIEGGWCFPLNCVIRPGMIFAHFCPTYDGMCDIANKGTEDFMAGAKRVDTCYGHQPSLQTA